MTLASTNYESVKYIGCVLQLTIVWNCNLDSEGTRLTLIFLIFKDCTTHYEVVRLDDGTGYSQKHATYSKDEDTISRDLIHYSGIKVMVSILGISERISAFAIFLYFFIAV